MRMLPLFRRRICTVYLLFFFVSFKLITNAPDGFQRPLIGNTFQLFTESFDMDIDSTGIALILEAPYLIKKLVTGVNTVRI